MLTTAEMKRGGLEPLHDEPEQRRRNLHHLQGAPEEVTIDAVEGMRKVDAELKSACA